METRAKVSKLVEQLRDDLKKEGNPVAELVELLWKDRNSPSPKYPDQALAALADPAVRDLLRKRLETSVLTDIKSLEYDMLTGLHPIYFEFTRAKGIACVPNAVLVLLTGFCRVVGIHDAFDRSKPNPVLPPIPEKGDQPFVIARPSASSQAVFTQEDLFPVEMRSRMYMSRMGGCPEDEPLDCGAGGRAFRCMYTTVDYVSVPWDGPSPPIPRYSSDNCYDGCEPDEIWNPNL